MQNDTKRSMRTRRHGPATGPFSVRSKGSERELSRPVGFTDAKGSYERFIALAPPDRPAMQPKSRTITNMQSITSG